MTELYQNLDKSLKFVWIHTPWMVNHWTDHLGSIRYEEIYEWLCDRYGRGRCPIGRNDGNWMIGSATVRGHTWIGFETEAMMNEFLEEWR
jgi:hypothetical protein